MENEPVKIDKKYYLLRKGVNENGWYAELEEVTGYDDHYDKK